MAGPSPGQLSDEERSSDCPREAELTDAASWIDTQLDTEVPSCLSRLNLPGAQKGVKERCLEAGEKWALLVRTMPFGCRCHHRPVCRAGDLMEAFLLCALLGLLFVADFLFCMALGYEILRAAGP